MNDTLNNQAQQIWQSQPVEGMKMSAEAIRVRAGKFERRIWRRNLRESIIGLGVIIWFSYFFATAPQISFRITWGLFIAGMIWIMVSLFLKGSPRSMPADMGSSTCLDFFRSELERQRNLLKSVWLWHLGPLLPAYAALNVASALAFPRAIRWGSLALMNVFFIAVFFGVWKLNQRAARCLQRSIDELDKAKTWQ
jgi:uncharacterized membrane protein YqjE